MIIKMVKHRKIITGLNVYFSDNRGSLIKYDGILLLSTILGILLNSFLYFMLKSYDAEGMIVMYAELFIAVLYVLLLSGISMIVFYAREKRKNR